MGQATILLVPSVWLRPSDLVDARATPPQKSSLSPTPFPDQRHADHHPDQKSHAPAPPADGYPTRLNWRMA